MSKATIDLTRRTRIRTLAARMHRAGIAGVFSTAGGVPAVDESALTEDQRLEATKILDADVPVEDVETAVSVAAMIPRYVKPSCPICHGGGLARGSVDNFCVCVDRRWQATIDHQAFVDTLRAPRHDFGARVESTRAADDAKRIEVAKDVLDRARAVQAAACGDLDGKIKDLEDTGAAYFAEREKIDASRAASKALAEEQERLAEEYTRLVAEGDARAEEIALQLGRLIEPLFRAYLAGFDDDDRAQAHTAVDEVYATAALVSTRRVARKASEEAGQRARADERACEQQIAVIDAANAPLVGTIERLRAERARIARHHQPKIDRAEKRLRRLTYLAGDTGGDENTEATTL